MNLKNVTFDYQRNGVTGEGFFQAHFTFDGIKLVAVIFDELPRIREYTKRTRVMNPKCGIVDPATPGNHWRGDNFADALYPMLVKWYDEKWGTAR